MQYSVRWSEQIVWNHPYRFSIAFMGKHVSIYVVSNKVSEPTTASFGGRLYTTACITKCSTGPANQAFGNTVINTVKISYIPAPWPVQVWQTSELTTEV